MAVGMTAVALLAAASGSWAQAALTAKVEASGLVRLYSGDVELATIDLNAHGLQWKHAPQATATAAVSDLPDHAGKRVVGTLPVPGPEGGAIQFTETVRALPQGLQFEYDLSVTKAMKLNGLQLSIELPVARYAGKELVIARPEGDPQTVSLPQEKAENFTVWGGEGARIEVAKGTAEAVTIELRAATNIVVQDLRQWDNAIFEVRLPAIMDDGGRDVTADDRFHLDFTITLGGPVTLVGP